MEKLLGLREPAAVVLLVTIALTLLVGVATAVLYADAGRAGELGGIAPLVSFRTVDPVTVAVTVAVIAGCVLVEPTRHARGLVVAGLVLIGLSTVVALVYGVIAMASSLLDGADVVTQLVVPALGLAVLGRLLRVLPARAAAPVPLPAAPETPAIGSAADVAYQPTWLPDAAAGAAWYTAGDAAAGAPATGWGQPGQPRGWEPDPTLRPGPDRGDDQGPQYQVNP